MITFLLYFKKLQLLCLCILYASIIETLADLLHFKRSVWRSWHISKMNPHQWKYYVKIWKLLQAQNVSANWFIYQKL